MAVAAVKLCSLAKQLHASIAEGFNDKMLDHHFVYIDCFQFCINGNEVLQAYIEVLSTIFYSETIQLQCTQYMYPMKLRSGILCCASCSLVL